MSFLLIDIYGSSMEKHLQITCCELTFLLEDLEYYKDTKMKAYNITKLTAKLKSDDIHYRNKN